ncbi:MAG: hypothetical protein H6648_08115 [Caldilineae bacterium]|nr:hypothetical protein [Chloroflexota bacterium]MCB9177110.1 hypothetical protein [Caldilineae bacterium]
MDASEDRRSRGPWAIGGSLLIGLGAGFFFLEQNPLAFVACIFVGLGVGLVLAALLSR